MAYVSPQKRISVPADMELWKSSAAYHDYLDFLKQMNASVIGRNNQSKCQESAMIDNLLSMLDILDKWIDDIPPIQQPQRFGNQAFRSYHARLVQESFVLIKKIIPDGCSQAVNELIPYLCDSFGNSTRIDYGTGHEASFVMFLCCLWKLAILEKHDFLPAVIKVFKRYLDICRHLQLTYKMEPAGSHGVWSLDDFQFIPFIWGSSQLIDHPDYDPRSFLDEQIVARTKDEYLWMGCIDFIEKVKSGPFAEHSNQLWSISAVPTWSKVNSGLFKMYEAEVLHKFPVAQHFLFGSLLAFEPRK